MGSGGWSSSSYANYAINKGMSVDTSGSITTSFSNQDNFKSKRLPHCLNPKGVMRECRDSAEHPCTIPVILALDVTGSMGEAAVEVAKKLGTIMSDLYNSVKDVEFMIMGIGDLAYDDAPIQASQFESDIRIAEQLDKVYFEFGGGGNGFESYTAAWYFGLRHTDLDCWKRGKKGIIITMGDEPLNPYLPVTALNHVCGDTNESSIDTYDLYNEVTKKFDIYHIAVNSRYTCFRQYEDRCNQSYGKYLDENHYIVATMDSIASTIVDIIKQSASSDTASSDFVVQPLVENIESETPTASNNFADGISW